MQPYTDNNIRFCIHQPVTIVSCPNTTRDSAATPPGRELQFLFYYLNCYSLPECLKEQENTHTHGWDIKPVTGRSKIFAVRKL